MEAEQVRLWNMYARFLPRVLMGGSLESTPSHIKSLSSNQKVAYVQQAISKERRQKIDPDTPYQLQFKSGFFYDLCAGTALQQTDCVISFFYLEQICKNKDHLLHFLTFVSVNLKRGGYFIGTAFDAVEVLMTYTQDVEGKYVRIPNETFENCQLHLLDGKNNLTYLSSLKIPLDSEFYLLNLSETQQSHLGLPARCNLFDWNAMKKQILRFGFRLVETRLFLLDEKQFPHTIGRSFVFQLVDECLFL
jgi:hypothetical protein